MSAFHDLTTRRPHPSTPEQWIDRLQRFLIRRLTHAHINDVIATALHEIEHAHGRLSVEDVAVRCGVSPRHLHRLMRVWATLGAGRVTGLIVGQSTVVRLMPGILLLLAFIPQHIILWDKFPIWYHFTFLLSLVPLTYVGGVLVTMNSAEHAQHAEARI